MPKECPMCGEQMRLRAREVTTRLPGSGTTRVRQAHEWTCPECDYFEESDEESEES
jgi:YgiT-type zinc finger domain-containing protein